MANGEFCLGSDQAKALSDRDWAALVVYGAVVTGRNVLLLSGVAAGHALRAASSSGPKVSVPRVRGWRLP